MTRWPTSYSLRCYLNDGHSLQRELASYVTVSIDNLVSLKEKQLMESASQRAGELKPLGHESLPHFSPNPHSWSEQNPKFP